MQGRNISGVTPQQKMVAVNNRFGNSNIKGQQGSTRVLFDSIDFNGQTEFRFFENAGSKTYPFTNIGAEGNRLNVGDTFVVQKIYFGIATVNADTGAITDFSQGNSSIANLFKGELNFQIANSLVIKQLPIVAFANAFANPTANNENDVALETFTDIVIPPLLEYVLTIRTANAITQANTKLYCFIEGSAGIIAPQTTF
jgi:hypothetical protein